MKFDEIRWGGEEKEKVLFCGIRGVFLVKEGWISQVIKYTENPWSGDVKRFVLQKDGSWKEYGKGYTFTKEDNLISESDVFDCRNGQFKPITGEEK